MIRTRELTAVTSTNTMYLNKISDLTKFQMGVEKTLAASQARLLTDHPSARQKEAQQRDKLVRKVNQQAATLENLKQQLAALKRKDTSVYT